jgi:cellulose synthase/poly-beta-1,6-N-acetylglucosamine synthase-like glycosyltransferase
VAHAAAGRVAAPSAAGSRESGDAESIRGVALHLAIALAAFVIIGVAQLYAFAEMAVLAERSRGLVKALLAISASAFLVFTLLSALRQSVLMICAYGGAASGARLRVVERSRWPTVSILVPACNEGGRIEKAIESILAVDYPELDVVVVDDGSTDDTFARASRLAGRHGAKRVRVLRKENGGKWSALNLAFHHASGELVVCMDADSQLAPDSIKLLARHFDEPTLGGCCGQVVVRNCSNLITRLQALEYVLLNGLLRQAHSAFGTVLVAPGPLAMFRRRVLEEVWKSWGRAQALPITRPGQRVHGPWEDDTFAEDADLTINVLLTGYGVRYEPRSISRTSAPASIFRLLNQRYRWTRGNYQAAVKAWRRWHRAPRARRTLPIWLATLFFETVALPGLNLFGLLAFVVVVAAFGFHAPLLVWFLSLTALDLNVGAFTARLEGADLRLLRLTLVSRVYYNVLLDVSKYFALYDELRGKRMRWS